MMTGIKELMQPSFQLEPLLTLLVERLVHLLNNVHVQSRSGNTHRAAFTIMLSPKNIIISDHTCICLSRNSYVRGWIIEDCEIVECCFGFFFSC